VGITQTEYISAAVFIRIEETNCPNMGKNITRRQQEILEYILEGHTAERIAEFLDISPETVRVHTKAVLRIFGVRTKAELLAMKIRGEF
jgi:DNA-binding CsgD family transcriptional regulator